MAFHWLTPPEKKKVRQARKARALAEAERATYGDAGTTILSLKATLDRRSHAMLDRMSKRRINPRLSSLEVIGGASASMLQVVSLLRDRPHTMREIADALAHRCNYTASNAQREAYALVSILTTCERATRNGPHVELK